MVSPIDRGGAPDPSGRPSESRQQIEQRVKDEVGIAALSSFFAGIEKYSRTSLGGPQEKLKQIKDDLDQGVKTPADAATDILQVISEANQSLSMEIPPLGLNDTTAQSLVGDHLQLFLHFVSNDPTLQQLPAVGLLKEVPPSHLTTPRTLEDFEEAIAAVNAQLPESERYPNVPQAMSRIGIP